MKKEEVVPSINRSVGRRSFMKGSLLAGGAVVGAGLLSNATLLRAQESGSLNPGDVAILRFLAAVELIESDLWTQYAELGGLGHLPPIEVDPNEHLNPYQIALSNLDPDGPQYIKSNTLDEVSHATFLNAYLKSKGAERVVRQVAPHEPHAPHCRHQLVRSLPQRNQPGPRRHLSSGDYAQRCYCHSPR